MDTPLQLSMREVLAVSSNVSRYLHERTKKRCIPLGAAAPAAVPAAVLVVAATTVTEANVNSIEAGHLKRLYAYPSP